MDAEIKGGYLQSSSVFNTGVTIMKILSLLQGEISGGRKRWTIPFLILLSSFLAGFLQAQSPPPESPQAPPPETAPQQLSQEDLNRLLAPIALYPDALVALILPASTVPSDLVLAARYIASNGDPAQVANQPWDDSVKSLVRYPEVLKWMDQNLEWTTAVGEAFLNQPADVMNSVQRLRAEAIAAGNLTDTPQQHVVKEKACVRIVPAQPDVIYVPQYDPDVVYAQPYSQEDGPVLTFGAGFAVGSWLNYDCDWDRRNIYVGQWRPGWNHDRNWDGRNWNHGDQGWNNNIVNVVNINNDTARQWQPSANSLRQEARHQHGDPKHLSGGPSTSNVIRGANALANHIPKPSRPDFASQGNGGTNNQPTATQLTNATSGARGKNGKVRPPTTTANVPGQQGQPLHNGGQASASHNLSKHAHGSDQSKGGTNNQPKALAQQGTSAQKHQKHVAHSASSSSQSSNGQHHQQKHSTQPSPSSAKQNKHQDQHSEHAKGSVQQSHGTQPSNVSHGKGKGGGEKKSDKKKDKGGN
jgi:Protein of unknown function (DUF3300)